MVRIKLNAARQVAKQNWLQHCVQRAKTLSSKGYPSLAADYCMRGLAINHKETELLQLTVAIGNLLKLPELADPSVEYLRRNKMTLHPPTLPESKDGKEELTCFGDTTSIDFPPGIELKRGSSGALRWVATRYWAAGEVLWHENPIVVTLSDQICANCAHQVRTGSVLRCRRNPAECSDRYCSPSCRENAENTYHGPICGNKPYEAYVEKCIAGMQNPSSISSNTQNLKSNVAPFLSSSVALRCLILGRICAQATVRERHPLTLPEIAPLYGKLRYESVTAFNEVSSLALQLSAALRQPTFFLEDFMGLYTLIASNEMRIVKGLCVFPRRSLMDRNHSPNAAVDGGRVIVTQPIEVGNVVTGDGYDNKQR